MAIPIGSAVFALGAILVICCSVLLLLRHYLPLRTTPAYLLTPVFLSLALPTSLILLVPIDLASSLREHGQSAGIWLPEGAVLVAWRIAYWLTFALTWFILPLLGEYVDSGYRTPKDRVLYALKSNGQYYSIALGCAVAGLIYILWQNGFHGTSVKSLVMALAYCVGLIQAVLLLGHGLVAIPRHLFRNAGTRLRRLQTRAPKIREKWEDAMAELQDLNRQVEQLQRRKSGVSKDMEDWIEELGETGSHVVQVPPTVLPTEQRKPLPAVITERYLADLGRRLMRARHKAIRFTHTWNRLVQEAADTQAIIDSVATKRLEFQKDSTQPKILQIPLITPYTRYIVYRRIQPTTRIFLGVLFAFASVSIIWSELVKFVAPQISMISLTVVRYSDPETPKVGFGGQVVSFLWILYMCTCTLSSLGDIKVWGNRALVRRNTYGESACWYSCQVAKLTVPLTYNFLTFTPRAVHRETVFFNFLGKLIILTPLGKGFDYFFPILILVPACATLFNIYGRVKKLFGFGIIDDDDESSSFGTGSWREGRNLIESELQGRTNLASTTLPSQSYTDGAYEEQASTPTARPPGSRIPTLYVPPAPENNVFRDDESQAQRLSAATQAAEEEDESIFSGFAHRVRNTFENIERPDWLPEVGKKPKWMGGSSAGRPINASARPGGASRQQSNGIGRWLGGRTASGRIRL